MCRPSRATKTGFIAAAVSETMTVECPVCGGPHPDGVHLANHLAFTAIGGDRDHEAWLEKHVPDWGSSDPTTLGRRLVEGTDHPVGVDDDAGEVPRQQSGTGEPPGSERPSPLHGGVVADSVAGDVLEEARALSRAMYGDVDRVEDGDDPNTEDAGEIDEGGR